jgi:tRNA-specific 2-thiouridylase
LYNNLAMSKEKKSVKKVLIALSGGVDSAVSAYLLLKQGYEVEAAFMKNWSSTKGLLKNECPWLIDRRDALRVAAFLHIPLYTLDFEKEYQKKVMKYFFEEYRKGCTPNPDVMCNKEIKFKLLYDWAKKRGFDYLATGHYAKITKSEKRKAKSIPTPNPSPSVGRGRGEVVFNLLRSVDEFKDQTYFIYNIKTNQLPHLLFPVGGMKKTQVRALAKKIGLPNADKRESMGLCFVGKIRLQEFLSQKLKLKTGSILDQCGQILGQHEGLHNYTIGQRQGIKIGATGPYYVFRKDLKTNRLYVTNNPNDKRLLTKELQIHSVNWITPPNLLFSKEGEKGGVQSRIKVQGLGINLLGRYRHQGELVPLTISRIDNGHYRIIFKKPQKAVASGQSLVLYKGKVCLGGGVIV